MLFTKKQSGFTLLELAIVLLTLLTWALLKMPAKHNEASAVTLCKVTDNTMQNIKKAIMEGYYPDTAGHFPASKKAGVISNDYNLKYLFEAGGWEALNPVTHTGWNGPYVEGGLLLTETGKYSAANLHSSFKNPSYVHDPNLADDIHPLQNGDTVILDGWKRPLIIQVYCSERHYTNQAECENNRQQWIARLVSAGAGIGLKLNDAAINTPIGQNKRDDDRVLYLNVATPPQDVNMPCNQL
jgi:competence protein ComGC